MDTLLKVMRHGGLLLTLFMNCLEEGFSETESEFLWRVYQGACS